MAAINFPPPKAQQQACVPYPQEVRNLNKDTLIITVGEQSFYITGHGVCICSNEEDLNKITQFRGAPKRKAGSDDEEDEQLAKQQKAKKRALAAVERCKQALNDKDKEMLQKVLETPAPVKADSEVVSQPGAPIKTNPEDAVAKVLEAAFSDSATQA
jgi:hypothetical protein